MEQTTSSAWPNVLATDYMITTGAIQPDVEMKAREYISLGYQKLVTFECESGGFNWWVGDNPGNAVLSALAVMMFTDTAKIQFIDKALIDRTAKWLADRQKSDGSWAEETHLHAGNETLGASSLRATAYTAWALLHAEREDAAAKKAVAWIKQEVKKETDIYAIAMSVMAIAMANPTDSALSPLLQTIHDARKEDGDNVYWSSESTMVNGWGDNAAIETTALVALAFMEAGGFPNDVQGAINYLVGAKDSQGNWGYSTQATVLALKALLASLSSGAPKTDASVKVLFNGKLAAERKFDDFNADVMWQVELADKTIEGDNEVEIQYEGIGNLMYQVTGVHYLPWTDVEPQKSALTIDVVYDKTQLMVDDIIHVTVNVKNSDPALNGMVLAEMGLPPGFQVDTSELQKLVTQKVVQKVEKTAMQLLVYIDAVTPEKPVTFTYDLIAQYPLEASAPKSEAYFYYNKEEKSEAPPVEVKVE